MTHDDTLRDEQAESQVIAGTTADTVDAHTPDPVQPPVVEHVPDPPTPNNEGMAALQTTVAGIATAVATLTDTVTKLAVGRDASPAKPPWTHLGSKASHEN